MPYPPFRGDKLKIFNLAKRLCKQHELHLITFAQNEDDWTYEAELKKIFTTVKFIGLPKWKSLLNTGLGLFNSKPFQVNYFSSNTMKSTIDVFLKDQQIDVVHVQHLRMAQYLFAQKNIPRILDLPDAFSLYWSRKQATSRNPIIRLLEQWEQKKVYRYEQILSAYNLALVCSKEDKQYLEEQHQISNVALLPNGVDTEVFCTNNHDYSHNNILLFTGNMDYRPNIDAVCYFVESILPKVKVKYPDVQFIIAGQRPVAKVLSLANDSVKVTGFIPNLALQYNAASVVVAPLRFGAGTQNKVLEAMAMGVPVVCSNIGFEGLGIRSGEGAIMQTDADAFASSIVELLSSTAMRKEVGQKGVSVIQNNFSWDIIAAQLAAYLKGIC